VVGAGVVLTGLLAVPATAHAATAPTFGRQSDDAPASGCHPAGFPTFNHGSSFRGGPGLTYYGGPVVSSIHSIDVSYGPPRTSPERNADHQLHQPVPRQRCHGLVSDYDTPTQSIGRGTSGGAVTITPSVGNDGSNIGLQHPGRTGGTDHAGQLPAPTADTSYAVLSGRGSRSATLRALFSGGRRILRLPPDHDLRRRDVHYQVMPDLTGSSAVGPGRTRRTPPPCCLMSSPRPSPTRASASPRGSAPRSAGTNSTRVRSRHLQRSARDVRRDGRHRLHVQTLWEQRHK